jgi:putative RecB family exonuclease
VTPGAYDERIMTETAVEPAWTIPTSLSPSRVESFLSCPLAFRFASIEKLPDPPTVATTRGSLVHRALELLFLEPAPDRTSDALDRCVDVAIEEYRVHDDFVLLGLDGDAADRVLRRGRRSLRTTCAWRIPRTVRDIGLELRSKHPSAT